MVNVTSTRQTAHVATKLGSTALPDGDYRLEVGDAYILDEDGITSCVASYEVMAPAAIAGFRFTETMLLEGGTGLANESGQRALASLCRSVGAPGAGDLEDVLFIEFAATIAQGGIGRFCFPDEGPMPAARLFEPLAFTARRPWSNDNRS